MSKIKRYLVFFFIIEIVIFFNFIYDFHKYPNQTTCILTFFFKNET